MLYLKQSEGGPQALFNDTKMAALLQLNKVISFTCKCTNTS